MSLNSYANTARRAHLREQAEMADYGLNGSMSNEDIMNFSWFENHEMGRLYTCWITNQVYTKIEGKTIDWGHLSCLVRDAVADSGFTDLPWNLTNMVNAGVAPGSYPRYASEAGEREVVAAVHRFCGWLRAAAKLPGLRRAIEKTQSSRGMHSSRTTVSLWDVSRRFPSPGGLERKLWAVRESASIRMRLYDENLAPSWVGIVQGLMARRQTGKAATIAVAATLANRPYEVATYRQARAWLQEYQTCIVEDTSDGVFAKREEKPRLEKMEVAVYRIAIPKRNRAGHKVSTSLGWLVRSVEGRTYHDEYSVSARTALVRALYAWREQDRLATEAAKTAAEEADFIDFLQGNQGFSPLIFRDNSKEAGNCLPGTEAWLRKQGWADRKYIPAAWLVPHLDYNLVRNVATSVYRRHTEYTNT